MNHITSMSLIVRFFLFFLVASTARAEVVRVEVTERSDLGTTYEQIIGRLHFEIGPAHPGNAVIEDVELAPVNASGRVSFSSDLRILKPKDAALSNGAVWVEIPNRGGTGSLSAAMMAQGFTMMSVGWEFDVPKDSEKMSIEVPAARNRDGSTIRGVVSATFTPDNLTDDKLLTDLAAYPPVDIEAAESRLIVRTRVAYPGGEEVPRDKWSLQDNRIRLQGGFEAGKTYEVFYLAEAPPIGGLGYAAIRDAVAWLKHGEDSLAPVKYAYAFGSSQCGRFLRDLVYLGFNTDEQDRQTLDGLIAQVAGAGRLVLNQRWSTPRGVAGYYTASYPFADTAQRDEVSGLAEGILENPRVKHAPKIFYTNMAAEYWGAGRVAALTHTTPDGAEDIELPENVRSYFFASTSHGPSSFPPRSQVEGSLRANPVTAQAAIYELRQVMHRWVEKDIAPPASVYPKLSEGTLTPITEVCFPKVPGFASPNAVTAGPRIRNPLWPDDAGEGTDLPLLVPQVDADGNDLGGIRMPDVAVPLATATGWVFRPEEYGSPEDFYLLRGAWVPFAVTKVQREKNSDPRLSLEERYASKQDFMEQVKAAVEKLIEQGFLAETDLESQLKQSADRWDWIMQEAAE